MKLNYRFFIVAFASFCASCSFSTKAQHTDYLINNYVLKNVVDYKETLMNEHTFINTGGLAVYNAYFNLDDCIISFKHGDSADKISFDFILSLKDKATISINDVNYSYKYSSKFDVNYTGDDFRFDEVTVFPNYWLRIGTSFIIGGEAKTLIFEYMSKGQNK